MKVKMLIVVDTQNDFISGALGSPDAMATLGNIVEKIRRFEDHECVVFTMDSHYDDYLHTPEGKMLPIEHCLMGTEGWAFPQEIEDLMEELDMEENPIVLKDQFGAPNITEPVEMLIHKKSKDTGIYIAPKDIEIEIIGLCTDICVMANAIMLKTQLDPEICVKVVSDCCAGSTSEKHDMALELMKGLGIEVV